MSSTRHYIDVDMPMVEVYRALVAEGQAQVTYQQVCKRVRNGWSYWDALLTPPAKRGRAKGESK